MDSKPDALNQKTRIHTAQPLLTRPSYIELEVLYDLEASVVGGLEILASAGLVLEKKRFQGSEVSLESRMQVGYRKTG